MVTVVVQCVAANMANIVIWSPCACRARIEAIKARNAGEKEAEADGESGTKQGRKLSTMRVDPKVKLGFEISEC